METDALIRDYLARLETAAARLPAGRRAELVADVREHITAALATSDSPDEATVRNVLERLGSPEEIVAAESEASGERTEPAAMTIGGEGAVAAARPGMGALEVVALLLVTVGAFVLPIIGPAIGIGLVWLSRAWSTRLKLVVTAIVLVVLILPIVGLMSVGGGAA